MFNIKRNNFQFIQEKKYSLFINTRDDILLVIKPKKGQPNSPYVLYDGGNHALLFRDDSQIIILDYILPEAKDLMINKDYILISEIEEKGNVVCEYDVKIIPCKKVNFDFEKFLEVGDLPAEKLKEIRALAMEKNPDLELIDKKMSELIE